MLDIIFGRSRSGKTYVIQKRLEQSLLEHAGEIVLIVPEQFSFQSEKDMLRLVSLEQLSRINVLSFSRLIDEVGRVSGGLAGQRISDGIRKVMVAEAMRSVAHELTVFASPASDPDFAEPMTAAMTEFKQASFNGEALIKICDNLSEGRLKWKLHDIGLVMSAYDALISNTFIDPADDMTRLGRMLDRCDWLCGKRIFIDSFKGFTAGEFEIIERMIAKAESVTVTLPGDGPEDNDEGAGIFSNIKKTARRLMRFAEQHGVKTEFSVLPQSRYTCAELEFLERELFNDNDTKYSGNADGITLCQCDFPFDEMRFAAAQIRRMVRDEGCRYRDFVVVARDAESYADIAETVMKSYCVPCHIDRKTKAVDLPVTVFALSAVEASANFSTAAVMRWLKTGLTGFDSSEISELENYTYIWNISGNAWLDEWKGNPGGLEGKASAEAEETLSRLNLMRSRIVSSLSRLKKGLNGSAVAMATALFDHVRECGAAEHIEQKAAALESTGRNNDAAVMRQSYEALTGVLSDVVRCFENAPAVDPQRFIKAFKMAMSEYDIGTIPMGIDEVTFGSANLIRSDRPKVVFCIGVNQDVFPRTVSSEGLIIARERRTLIDAGIQINDCSASAAAEEKFILYNSVCSPSQKLFVTYASADMSGGLLEKSIYVDRIEKMFPECRKVSSSGLDAELIQSVDSAKSCYFRHYRERDGIAASLQSFFSERFPDTEAELKRLSGKEDVSVSPDRAKELFGRNLRLSATQLDSYYKCPFMYFCKFGLRAAKLKRADINAMQRGTIVHYVFENMIKTYGKSMAELSPDGINEAVHGFIDAYIKSILGDLTLEDRNWKLVLRQTGELLCTLCAEMAKQLTDSDFKTAGCEVKLEDGGVIDPVSVPLSDGSVKFIGTVDRIDIWKSAGTEYVCVVDYKTGKKKFHLPDVLYGLNMQMILYLFAAVKGRQGRFSGDVPAGVLYIPSERVVSEENEQSELTNPFSGIVLNDYEMLGALEKSRSGRFIPIKYKKDMTLTASSERNTVMPDEFELLFSCAEQKLREMGEKLHNGEVPVSPTDGVDGVSSACKYCDYRIVCGREPAAVNRQAENLSNSEIYRRLRGEQDA